MLGREPPLETGVDLLGQGVEVGLGRRGGRGGGPLGRAPALGAFGGARGQAAIGRGGQRPGRHRVRLGRRGGRWERRGDGRRGPLWTRRRAGRPGLPRRGQRAPRRPVAGRRRRLVGRGAGRRGGGGRHGDTRGRLGGGAPGGAGPDLVPPGPPGGHGGDEAGAGDRREVRQLVGKQAPAKGRGLVALVADDDRPVEGQGIGREGAGDARSS